MNPLPRSRYAHQTAANRTWLPTGDRAATLTVIAGIVEYTQQLNRGSGDSGSKGVLERCIKVLESAILFFMPGKLGFWIVLTVVALLIVFRLFFGRSAGKTGRE